MTYWEALSLVGVMATILGVFLTIYGVINNKTLKEEFGRIREILTRIERSQGEAGREIAGAVRHLAQLIEQGRGGGASGS